jgi:hypothetical protein
MGPLLLLLLLLLRACAFTRSTGEGTSGHFPQGNPLGNIGGILCETWRNPGCHKSMYMYAVLTEPKMGTAVNRYGGKDRQ